MQAQAELLNNKQITERDLEGLRLLTGASTRVVANLLDQCEIQTLAPDEILLTPETPNANLYLILRGRMRLHVGSPDTEPVYFVEAGDAVGEMSMISEKPVMGFVIADEETVVLKIEEDVFWSLIYTERAVSRNVLWMMVEKLRLCAAALAGQPAPSDSVRKVERTDELADINERARFEQLLRRQLLRCTMGGRTLSLMYITVNGMDRFTHEFGAQASRHAVDTVANVLLENIRPTDIIGRIDGRHFAVALSDCDAAAATSTAKRLCAEVGETIIALPDDSLLPPLSLSVGVAASPNFAEADSLLRAAREALLRASRQGCPVVAFGGA